MSRPFAHRSMTRLLLLAVTATIAACMAVPAGNPLAGTTWTLESVWEDDREVFPSQEDMDAADRPAVISFDAEERGVRVSSCNSCAGLYTVGDRTLEITRLACTRMACPGRLELDRYVAGRSRWRIEDDRLILDVDDRINGLRATLTFAPGDATSE